MYSLKDTKREPMTVKCIPSLSVENSNSSATTIPSISASQMHTHMWTHIHAQVVHTDTHTLR